MIPTIRVAVLIGVLLLAALAFSVARDPIQAPSERSTLPPTSAHSEHAFEDLAHENESLRARMAAIEARLNTPAPVDTSTPALEPLASEAPPVAAEPPENPELQQEERIAVFDDRLATEASETALALDLENAIRGALDEIEIDTGALLDSRCSESLCRAELSFRDLDARDEALQGVPYWVPWETNGFARVDPEDPLRLVLYMSTDTKALP